MEVISFRIPKELKEKMKKFKYINWSKAIREKIEEIIEKEESRKPCDSSFIERKSGNYP